MNYDHQLDQMIAGDVPCTGLGHAAHLGTAHAALRRWEFFEAAYRYAAAIRATAATAGAPDKFNATVTLAFICLVAERIGDEDSATFVAQNPDLGAEALAKAGYDAPRLADPKARRIGLLPRPSPGDSDQTVPAAG